MREATLQEIAIWRLREAGLNYAEIASKAKCSRSIVAGALSRIRHGKVTMARPKQGGCRWVYGDPHRPGWSWCDSPVTGEGAWCGEHRARVYRPFAQKVQLNVV